MFRHVVVAGTFDRLHKGHEAVLARAFAEGERVTIGLTTDEYVRNDKSKAQNPKSQINPKLKIQNRLEIRNLKLEIRRYIERKKHLEQWLKKNDYEQRARIIPLDDPYGSVIPSSHHTAPSPDVEAIVVSSQTRPRAEEINQLRIEAGWKPLAIIEVAMVPAEDLVPISSTRVRRKEIYRDGRLVLPDNLRPELQKPLGKVLMGSEIERSIAARQSLTLIAVITVGDVATKTLLDAGVTPSLAIIDGRVGRKPFHKTLKMLQLQKVKPFSFKCVKSGPGYISQEAMKIIQDCLSYHISRVAYRVILVDGEEDLLALPAVAQAPLGAVVYYGQPRIADARGKPPIESVKGLPGTASMPGLVEVVVTEEKRREAKKLLAQFLKSDQSDQYSNE